MVDMLVITEGQLLPWPSDQTEMDDDARKTACQELSATYSVRVRRSSRSSMEHPADFAKEAVTS